MMAIDFIEHYQYVAYPINGSRSGVIYSDDHGATWEYGGATQINMTNNEVCDSPVPSAPSSWLSARGAT